MSFPDHIEQVLESFGISAETRSALLDSYLQYGAGVLDTFVDLTERIGGSVAELTPEALAPLRSMHVEKYVRQHHAKWSAGAPTESFFAPRVTEGRGMGLLSPLGKFDEDEEGFSGDVARAVRQIVGDDQPVPRGILVSGRNAHYGGRENTLSFDVVLSDLEDAVRVSLAEGRQHTVPGSIGETSGTVNGADKAALLWEVQPNVYRPGKGRNSGISKPFRKHRNWHVATLTAAILWLRSTDATIFVLRSSALAATHEVNPLEPVTEAVIEHHDRTVARVVDGLGLGLIEIDDAGEALLSGADLMNTGLTKRYKELGAAGCALRIMG